MSVLHLDRVSLSYPGQPEVLAGVTLSVRSGEAVAVVGRSGSGKTSLLNLAAGFLEPTGGMVRLDHKVVRGPGPERAVVFQDDALFPWLSARDNVAFALRLRGVGRAERRQRTDALLAKVGLAEAADRRIWELSGGMRQRVGIARALAAEPRFLLMDEPFGALDAMTRESMQDLLLEVSGASGAGILLITHSIEEALLLADRVVVFAPQPGRVVEDLSVTFRARALAGEPTRAIRGEAAFAGWRDHLTRSSAEVPA